MLDRILYDFNRCGVVGEETNKLVGYLAACSRKLDRPLAVMVQSSSAAGKSSLMEAVLSFTPEEERIQYSAMTGQSLFYMGENDLKHKILAIAGEHHMQVPVSSQTTAPTGQRHHKPVVITKRVDKSSPLLAVALNTGEKITDWQLSAYRYDGAGSVEKYYTITLGGVCIVDIWTEFPDMRGPHDMYPVERVAFSYHSIKWQHLSAGTTGMDSWNDKYDD